MLACLLYYGNYYVVEEHELECSKYHSSDGNPSVCEIPIKYMELKQEKMKEGKKYSYREDYKGISYESSPDFCYIERENPERKNENTCHYQSYSNEKREKKSYLTIRTSKKGKNIPRSNITKYH